MKKCTLHSILGTTFLKIKSKKITALSAELNARILEENIFEFNFLEIELGIWIYWLKCFPQSLILASGRYLKELSNSYASFM